MVNLFFLFILPFVNCDSVVQTNSGPVRGITLHEKNVEAFLGIPYAEPPVGNLRFAKPTPKSPWTEIYDAKELPPTCVQCTPFSLFYNQSQKMSEDCLHLNLWVPKSESTTLKTIMIFIHGGGFMTGSTNANLYNGAALAHHGDVIVASINYRVGTLGFFSAFNDEAAGNMAMYDQILASQWMKDNAKHFGGDPDNIVLFGESAGAFSVSLHMVSPLSKNLFKRAILQSGSVFNPLYSDDNMVLRMRSQKISTLVGCAENDEELNENPKAVVECMKNLPADKIAEADEVLFKRLTTFIPPRVGDTFLPNTPTDLIQKGQIKNTEVLLGVNRNEGSLFVALILGYEKTDQFGKTIDVNNFDKTAFKEAIQDLTQNEDFNKIAQKYLKRVNEVPKYTYLNAASDFIGDPLITCPTLFLADFQSLRNPAYFYLFDYRGPSSEFAEWMGVPHFDEIQYVFGNPLMNTFSKEEEELSKNVMDIWVTFAKTGIPSTPSGLKWPKYTHEDPKYLLIDTKDRVSVKPDHHRCEAWRSVFGATMDD